LTSFVSSLPSKGLVSRDIDSDHHDIAVEHNAAQRRLTRTLQSAPVIHFDDTSRLVFFSDLHRGDDGPADAFRHNKALFLHALESYYEKGYTYVEVGDGDELWKNRGMEDVRRAHAPIYRALERFRRAGRMHLLIGNHQLLGPKRTRQHQSNGQLGGEALLLVHDRTGQRILVTHGHQGDGINARIYGPARLMVRHFWRHLQQNGMRTTLPETEAHHSEPNWLKRATAWSHRGQRRVEERIKGWLKSNQGLAVICGHTHRAAFAQAGKQPYFNCGSGVRPGYITGLEISEGTIRLVSWRDRPKEGPGAQSLTAGEIHRYVLDGPRPVDALA
jgi:UDP-2,3-diacylglucosamine pyrophosphatase LpxH